MSSRESEREVMPCPDCKAGYSPTYEHLSRHVNSLMWDRAVASDPVYQQITTFLCGRKAGSSIGHDSLDAWAAAIKIGDLAGLPDGWEKCLTCEGSAEVAATKGTDHE